MDYDSLLKLFKYFPHELSSLKRAQILCFYMGRLDLFHDLSQQVLSPEEVLSGIILVERRHIIQNDDILFEVGRISEADEAAKKDSR